MSFWCAKQYLPNLLSEYQKRQQGGVSSVVWFSLNQCPSFVFSSWWTLRLRQKWSAAYALTLRRKWNQLFGIKNSVDEKPLFYWNRAQGRLWMAWLFDMLLHKSLAMFTERLNEKNTQLYALQLWCWSQDIKGELQTCECFLISQQLQVCLSPQKNVCLPLTLTTIHCFPCRLCGI